MPSSSTWADIKTDQSAGQETSVTWIQQWQRRQQPLQLVKNFADHIRLLLIRTSFHVSSRSTHICCFPSSCRALPHAVSCVSLAPAALGRPRGAAHLRRHPRRKLLERDVSVVVRVHLHTHPSRHPAPVVTESDVDPIHHQTAVHASCSQRQPEHERQCARQRGRWYRGCHRRPKVKLRSESHVDQHCSQNFLRDCANSRD